MRTFQRVLVRPVFSLFMLVSVDRGRRFVHCVQVRISLVAVRVAVNPFEHPRIADLLIMRALSAVAERFRGLQMPHI